nr:hypothetical protein [Tanacetum cinerariifolium]
MGDKSDKNEKENPISLHYLMLTRSNYAAWAIKMRVFMQAQGVWEDIEPRTRNMAIDVKKDKLALAAIYQGIPEDLLLSLVEKQTAKDAWEMLKTMYMGAERVKTAKVQTLKAEFETLSMKDTKIIDDFAMKRSKKGDDEQETSQRNTRSITSDNRGRGRGRRRGNGSGNQGGRGSGGGNQQRYGYHGFDKNHDKSIVKCYNCQQYGHYAAECRNPRRERNQEANLTQENNDGEPALLLSTFDEHDRFQEVFLNEENVTSRLKSTTNVSGDTSL